MEQTFYTGELKQHIQFGGKLYVVREGSDTVECRFLTENGDLIKDTFYKSELEEYVEVA